MAGVPAFPGFSQLIQPPQTPTLKSTRSRNCKLNSKLEFRSAYVTPPFSFASDETPPDSGFRCTHQYAEGLSQDLQSALDDGRNILDPSFTSSPYHKFPISVSGAALAFQLHLKLVRRELNRRLQSPTSLVGIPYFRRDNRSAGRHERETTRKGSRIAGSPRWLRF